MEGKNFNEFINTITQEFNNDAQQQLDDIKNIIKDWEETIITSSLSTVELLECQYKSLIRHRIARLRKLLDMDCPSLFIVRELTLCRQPYEAFIESDYAQRIIELRK